MEYNKLKFFWDTFGLNKFDLDNCHPEWIQEMYLTGLGVENYKNSGKSGGASNNAPIPDLNPRNKRGKNTQQRTEKLL